MTKQQEYIHKIYNISVDINLFFCETESDWLYTIALYIYYCKIIMHRPLVNRIGVI